MIYSLIDLRSCLQPAELQRLRLYRSARFALPARRLPIEFPNRHAFGFDSPIQLSFPSKSIRRVETEFDFVISAIASSTRAANSHTLELAAQLHRRWLYDFGLGLHF